MTLASALAALLLASGTTTPAPLTAGVDVEKSRPGAAATCALLTPGAEASPVETCLACHEGSGSGHPVGMAYGPAAYRVGPRLRPAAEVVRAGVFLPEGELRCTTCHDGRSQVRFRIALPPGTPASARGGTKPLCLACHAL